MSPSLRQKARSALSLLIVAFGVAALILSGGFVEDIFEQLAEALIHSQSGHLQVFRTGYFEHGTRSPEKYLIEHPDRVQSALTARPQVADTMTRLSFSGMINNGRTDLPIFVIGGPADGFDSFEAGQLSLCRDS